MANINVLSPYYVVINTTNLDSCLLELYVYTGTQTTSRGSVTYSIDSTAYNDEVVFEISELVKDYLDITFDGSYDSEMVWVDYQTTQTVSGTPQTPDAIVQLKGYYGYGYFEDGVNPQNDSYLMQSNTRILKLDDATLRIPVKAENSVEVTFESNGTQVYNTTLSASTASSTLINYVSNSTGVDTYKERVIADSGTFEDSTCLQSFIGSMVLNAVDTVYLDDGTTVTKLTVEDISECRYQPYKVTFINKFGAKQDIYFFKRSDVKLNTEDEKYNANTVSSGSYNTYDHRKKIFRKNGMETITLNSGFYPEEYNEVFRQLMLSELVWIEVDGQTLPVNISDRNFDFLEKVNEKLIKYQVTFEYAFDKINNVR